MVGVQIDQPPGLFPAVSPIAGCDLRQRPVVQPDDVLVRIELPGPVVSTAPQQAPLLVVMIMPAVDNAASSVSDRCDALTVGIVVVFGNAPALFADAFQPTPGIIGELPVSSRSSRGSQPFPGLVIKSFVVLAQQFSHRIMAPFTAGAQDAILHRGDCG